MVKEKAPAISVNMVVRNGELFIREALDSILSQTFTDYEFIIIDDGSTDKTPEILREYQDRDGRIRVYLGPRQGFTKGCNRAISLSSSEFIARQDADDISMSERLAKEYEYLAAHPDAAAVGSFFYEIKDNGDVFRKVSLPQRDGEIKAVFYKMNPFCHSSVMLRKSCVDAAGGYDESFKYAQDGELFMRLGKTYMLANLGEYLVKRRVSAHNTINKSREAQWHSIRCRIRSKQISRAPFYLRWYHIVKLFLYMLMPHKLIYWYQKYKVKVPDL